LFDAVAGTIGGYWGWGRSARGWVGGSWEVGGQQHAAAPKQQAGQV